LTFDNNGCTLLSKIEATPEPTVMTERADLLQGTLDLLILKSLLAGPLHGWAVSKRIRDWSSDVLQINQGSLYPALYRLEERGLIRAEWGTSSEGRRAKFYTLTAGGRKQFAGERADWRRFALAIEQVLEAT
jgi:transcriptional regulator